MFLLDTNVVSELRKVRSGKANPQVGAWAERADAVSLYLSSITIMELEIGVLQIARRDGPQGVLLSSWMNEQVLPAFSGRILPVDTEVAIRCAQMHVPDMRSDRDALIAATALVHGMTVATRNAADFLANGVAVVNPWNED